MANNQLLTARRAADDSVDAAVTTAVDPSAGRAPATWQRGVYGCLMLGALAGWALPVQAQLFPNPMISPRQAPGGAEQRPSGGPMPAHAPPSAQPSLQSMLPPAPASAQPLPLSSPSSNAPQDGKADAGVDWTGVPKALQDRLAAMQVSAIMDGAAILRIPVGAGQSTSQGLPGSMSPLPGVVPGIPGTGVAGAPMAAAGGTSVAPQRMTMLSIRHGEPFTLVGKHRLLPDIGPRSVALIWLDAPRAMGKATRQDESSKLVYYGEIDSSFITPQVPNRLETQDAQFVQQSSPQSQLSPQSGTLGVPTQNNGMNPSGSNSGSTATPTFR